MTLRKTSAPRARKTASKQLERLFDAAVWDMDGTIVDTEPLHYQAYVKVLYRFGLSMTECEYEQFHGSTDAAICQYLIDRHGLKLSLGDLLSKKEACFRFLLTTTLKARPGVINMLKGLRRRGVKLAVASSSTLASIHLVLDGLGIRHYFQAIASGEEVEHSKPAPDVFELAAKRLGIAPERCLAFEDSHNGTIAASAAGMCCIAIPCGSTVQDLSAARFQVTTLVGIDITLLVARGKLKQRRSAA